MCVYQIKPLLFAKKQGYTFVISSKEKWFFIIKGSEIMKRTKKEKSIEAYRKAIHIFICPICKQSLHVSKHQSLVCKNNHTFDFAKQGYVNLLTRPIKSQYDKQLFKSRRKLIRDSRLYHKLHKKILEVIAGFVPTSQNQPLKVLDAGCGEGSHIEKITIMDSKITMTTVGLDITKEAIQIAARDYEEHLWLVGDLANTPFVDHSFDVILNILSPANYTEFNRILSKGGLVIKIVPRQHYLVEVREVLKGEINEPSYDNEDVVNHFKKHLKLKDQFSLTYEKAVNEAEFTDLIKMTPLAWRVKDDQFQSLIKQKNKVTIDLEMLIGEKL